MAIKGRDIIEDNHLANAIEQGEKYVATVEKMNEAVKKLAGTLKDTFGANQAGTAKEFDQISRGVKQITDLKKKQTGINKTLAKSQENLVKAYKVENKEIQRNRILTNERNKTVKQQVQLDRAADGS